MPLTDKQIEKGYWYHRPMDDFPPEGKLLSEYNNEDQFSLFCTMGGETTKQISKREEIYETEIPRILTSVKVIWAHHISQNVYDAICKLDNLTSLHIDSNRIRDLSAIYNLKNLSHLGLENLTKVQDIKPLTGLTNLITLKIENFKKVDDFEPIASLVQLSGLQIDGGMYTAQNIESFNFLNSLLKLQYLTLRNSRSKAKNFDPISGLTNLQMLQCSTNYPKSEFNKLSSLKSLKYISSNIEVLINNKR